MFFTDDDGTFFLPSRDGPADGPLIDYLKGQKSRIVKLRGCRMNLPPQDEHVGSHNH